MKITEISRNANSLAESASTRKWGEGSDESCFRTHTRYRDKHLYQQVIACKSLHCERCGPRLREAAYRSARARFAKEEIVWVVYVRAHQVDRLRKKAGRADQPIESVPVSPEWNVVFSPYHFEGAGQITEEEMRRIFLVHRVTKRHHTRSGRWAPPKSTAKDNGVTLSRQYVSREAFENVAKRLHATVVEVGGVVFFKDQANLGPEYFRKALNKEEQRVRRERLRARGIELRVA